MGVCVGDICALDECKEEFMCMMSAGLMVEMC